MSDNDNQKNTDEKTNDNKKPQNNQRRRSRGRGPRRRRSRRHAYYCPDGKCFDYKDVDTLKKYIAETGKIKPRRQTRVCSRCQRELAREIKRARHLAMLPFAAGQLD